MAPVLALLVLGVWWPAAPLELEHSAMRVDEAGVVLSGAGAELRLEVTGWQRGTQHCSTRLETAFSEPGHALVLSRACGVSERWSSTDDPNRLEHDVWVSSKPRGSGPLRISLAARGAMLGHGSDGPVFGAPGSHVAWSYRSAFLMRGDRRVPLTLEFSEGAWVLEVPEVLLEEVGAFPLHIDPLLYELPVIALNGAASKGPLDDDVSQPSVAIDAPGTGNIAVAWIDERSGEGNVVASVYHPVGMIPFDTRRLTSTLAPERLPSVADCKDNSFLFAWEASLAGRPVVRYLRLKPDLSTGTATWSGDLGLNTAWPALTVDTAGDGGVVVVYLDLGDGGSTVTRVELEELTNGVNVFARAIGWIDGDGGPIEKVSVTAFGSETSVAVDRRSSIDLVGRQAQTVPGLAADVMFTVDGNHYLAIDDGSGVTTIVRQAALSLDQQYTAFVRQPRLGLYASGLSVWGFSDGGLTRVALAGGASTVLSPAPVGELMLDVASYGSTEALAWEEQVLGRRTIHAIRIEAGNTVNVLPQQIQNQRDVMVSFHDGRGLAVWRVGSTGLAGRWLDLAADGGVTAGPLFDLPTSAPPLAFGAAMGTTKSLVVWSTSMKALEYSAVDWGMPPVRASPGNTSAFIQSIAVDFDGATFRAALGGVGELKFLDFGDTTRVPQVITTRGDDARRVALDCLASSCLLVFEGLDGQLSLLGPNAPMPLDVELTAPFAVSNDGQQLLLVATTATNLLVKRFAPTTLVDQGSSVISAPPNRLTHLALSEDPNPWLILGERAVNPRLHVRRLASVTGFDMALGVDVTGPSITPLGPDRVLVGFSQFDSSSVSLLPKAMAITDTLRLDGGLDGGADAGSADAGSDDAGNDDAGSEDGGPSQADAGTGVQHFASASCSCASSDVVALMVMVIAWTTRRRRTN